MSWVIAHAISAVKSETPQSVVDDGMGAVVVSSDEIGYLSSTFTIGVRTAT